MPKLEQCIMTRVQAVWFLGKEAIHLAEKVVRALVGDGVWKLAEAPNEVINERGNPREIAVINGTAHIIHDLLEWFKNLAVEVPVH